MSLALLRSSNTLVYDILDDVHEEIFVTQPTHRNYLDLFTYYLYVVSHNSQSL